MRNVDGDVVEVGLDLRRNDELEPRWFVSFHHVSFSLGILGASRHQNVSRMIGMSVRL